MMNPKCINSANHSSKSSCLTLKIELRQGLLIRMGSFIMVFSRMDFQTKYFVTYNREMNLVVYISIAIPVNRFHRNDMSKFFDIFET